MFSETRYALNGDLRVAYRTSRQGPRDIVSVANWATCCEVFPELPYMPFKAKRSRHVAVAIPEVRVGRGIAVSPRQ